MTAKATEAKATPKRRMKQTTFVPVEEPPLVVQRMPIDQIRRDPDQPRTVFELDTIVTTLRVRPDGTAEEGFDIREPIQIRPTRPGEKHIDIDGAEVPGPVPPWTIVEGERRWRSARVVGLHSILVLPPKEMTPADALAAQLGASSGKAPLRPLELANGIQRLGLDMELEEIAQRTGLGVRAIRKAAKLATLSAPVKIALDCGAIDEKIALRLATLDSHAEQDEVLKELGKNPTLRSADEALERRHLLLVPELAGFDPEDKRLKPMACSRCPHNTQSQAQLWSEYGSSKVLCTKRSCYEEKRQQAWELVKKEGQKRGVEIIEGEAAEKLFPFKHAAVPQDDNLVALEEECPHATGKTWAQVLGEEAQPSVVARAHGRTRQLVKRDELVEKLERAGQQHIAEDERLAQATYAREQQERDARYKEQGENQRLAILIRGRVKAQFSQEFEGVRGKSLMRWLTHWLGFAVFSETGRDWKEIYDMLGIAFSEDEPDAFKSWLDRATESELRKAFVVLMFDLTRESYDVAIELLDIDTDALRADVAKNLPPEDETT